LCVRVGGSGWTAKQTRSLVQIHEYISAYARTPAILSSVGHARGYIVMKINTGQAPTLARLTLGVRVDFHTQFRLCGRNTHIQSEELCHQAHPCNSMAWRAYCMILCEGNCHRRSTHGCVGGLEGQGGLPNTRLLSWVIYPDTWVHLCLCAHPCFSIGCGACGWIFWA